MELSYQYRVDAIVDYCRDKSVLHLGCAGHGEFTDEEYLSDKCLHHRMCEVAETVVGVDYLKEHVDRMNALGYDVAYGDVTKLEDIWLNEKFSLLFW